MSADFDRPANRSCPGGGCASTIGHLNDERVDPQSARDIWLLGQARRALLRRIRSDAVKGNPPNSVSVHCYRILKSLIRQVARAGRLHMSPRVQRMCMWLANIEELPPLAPPAPAAAPKPWDHPLRPPTRRVVEEEP